MGDFRIEIDAVGGHGCNREMKDGEKVYGCGSMSCPDCITAEFVSKLARSGVLLKNGSLRHWPDQPSEVHDEFVIEDASLGNRAKRIRHGSF